MKWYQKLAVLGITGLALAASPFRDTSSLEEKVQNLNTRQKVERRVSEEDTREEVKSKDRSNGKKLEEITEANKILREFPENYPHTSEISKEEYEGAEKLFIHVPQSHYLSMDTNLGGRMGKLFAIAPYKIINNSQKAITNLVEKLKKTHDLEYIFSEGVYEEPEFEEARKEYERIFEKMQKDLKSYDMDAEQFKYVPGADNLLRMSEKIKVLPIEKERLESKVREVYDKKGMESEEFEEIQERREDYAVETVAEYERPLNVVIYGEGHDFENNIEKWNNENPDNIISYMEVHPSLSKEDKKTGKDE